LTQEQLNKLGEALKITDQNPEKVSSSASKATGSTAFLRSIIRKATIRKEGDKSETPSEYQRKVINLVNELDERQLEKLDRVLEEDQPFKEYTDEEPQQVYVEEY